MPIMCARWLPAVDNLPYRISRKARHCLLSERLVDAGMPYAVSLIHR